MLIDLIVGAALLLFGVFYWIWLRSPALRERIELPKHVFLEQAKRQDGNVCRPASPEASPRSQPL